MTGPVRTATDQLVAALATVPNVTATADPGSEMQLPAYVVGPPRLVWETSASDPTGGTFIVSAVCDADERAIERLVEMCSAAAAAVDSHMTNAAVTGADPGVYVQGTAQLPCYDITIEVGLA